MTDGGGAGTQQKVTATKHETACQLSLMVRAGVHKVAETETMCETKAGMLYVVVLLWLVVVLL